MVSPRADGWGGAQLEESRVLEARALLLCLLSPGCYEVSTFLVFGLTSEPKQQVSMGGLSNMS